MMGSVKNISTLAFKPVHSVAHMLPRDVHSKFTMEKKTWDGVKQGKVVTSSDGLSAVEDNLYGTRQIGLASCQWPSSMPPSTQVRSVHATLISSTLMT